MRIVFLVANFLFAFAKASDVAPLAALAEKYFQEKKYDSALTIYKEISALQPDLAIGYYNQSLCLYYSKKYNEVLELLNTNPGLDTMPEARWLKVSALTHVGRLEDATQLLTQLDKNDPRHYTTSKRISNLLLATFISKNWYYMIALLFITVLFMVLVDKTLSYKGR